MDRLINHIFSTLFPLTISLKTERILKNFRINRTNKNQVILTYHPETLQKNFNWNKNFSTIVNELNKFNFNVIITSPGHEKGTKKQVNFIKKLIKNKKNFLFVKSLGVKGYFQELKNSLFVIGNSSSGIIEVPYFKIPTINIGFRQKGRFLHDSIIQSGCTILNIKKSIIKANSENFKKKNKQNETLFWKWIYLTKNIKYY